MSAATAPPGALVPYNKYLGERLKDFIRYSEVKQVLYKVMDLQQERGSDFRSLAVLSAFPGEGKTLFCTALAMAYAETSQSKLLVVDTTTYHRPGSLVLRECLDPGHPQIDFLSLMEERRGANDGRSASTAYAERADVPRGTDYEPREDFSVSLVAEGEHALIGKAAKNWAKQYGLVLLDTTALTVKNKNNLDPALVARRSDASVLVAGRKFLDSPGLEEQLQALMNPSLHLIGVVSNEAYGR